MYRLIAAAFALTYMSGCCSPVRQNVASTIPLAAVIHQLREDLAQVRAETPASKLPLTKITVTLKVAAERATGKEIGVGPVPLNVPLSLKFTDNVTGSMENTVIFEWDGKDDNVLFRIKPKPNDM